MNTITSFTLLFMGLVSVAQQAVYYPWMPWILPAYPFFAQPYPFYNARLYLNPIIGQRERYICPHEEAELRSHYHPNMNDYARDNMVDDIKSRVSSKDKEVHSRSGSLTNIYPLDNEQRSRGKTSFENQLLARYFGSGVNIGTGVTANYLLKTSFVFITSTGTLCYAKSCIPAAQFGAGLSNVICGAKKRHAELLDDWNFISPSTVEKLVPTASVTLERIKFDTKPDHQQTDHNSPSLTVQSSFIDDQQQDESNFHLTISEYERQKRFLFVLTTTVTTYSFASTTYTSTLSPAAAGALTCRPSGIALC